MKKEMIYGKLTKQQREAGRLMESPSEFLGTIEITDAFFSEIENKNTNPIHLIPRGTYLVKADFDYSGTGEFMQLRLYPRKPSRVG